MKYLQLVISMIVVSLIVVTPVQAVCEVGKTDISGFCVSADPIGFASDLYGYGLGFIGGVGVLFVMYGGFIVLSSQGDANRIKQGRQYIFFSIIGIILAVSGLAVYQVIGGDILKIPGFQ